MAAKNPAADKAAKQKKMLIVLGVLMLAVAAFQVPKLMGGSSSTATPETTAADGTVAPATPVAGAPTAAPVAPVGLLPGEADKIVPTTTLGGVEIAAGKLARASQGQLASFSLFKPKDPFKPGVVEKSLDADATVGVKDGGKSGKATLGGDATTSDTPAKGGDSAGVTVGGSSGDSGPSVTPIAVEPTVTTPEKPVTVPVTPVTPVTPVETPVTTPEAPVEEKYAFATLAVNGAAESVAIKGQFPAVEPLFVLAEVRKGEAEIGIANGKLEKGKTVTLKVGKSLTLVDAASGVTYVVKLLTVGTQPDVTFTQGATGSTGDAASAATPSASTKVADTAASSDDKAGAADAGSDAASGSGSASGAADAGTSGDGAKTGDGATLSPNPATP